MKPGEFAKSYSKQMREIILEHRKLHPKEWPATADRITDWIWESGLWEPRAGEIRKILKKDVGQVLREMHHIDGDGTRVRTMGAAKKMVKSASGKTKQEWFWEVMADASEEHLRSALWERSRQIVADTRQLLTDAKSYNKAREANGLLPIDLDFLGLDDDGAGVKTDG